jgi:alpha-L-fucosidase 2
VFASAPDQVIVVRLTASRPGQISFEARLQTPQRATVEISPSGDLVMQGVNGDGRGSTADGKPLNGALRFEARVRVLASGGSRSNSGGAIAVRGANTATLLISAATSYRNYEDVRGDPAASVAASLGRASGKSIEALRAAHVRDYQQLFDRVTLDLGSQQPIPGRQTARVRDF